MAVWSIALRLILMLALVLNGTASAVAGVRMAAGHDHGAQVSDTQERPGGMHDAGCPKHARHGVAMSQPGEHHATQGHLSTPSAPAPDCCKADACQCACTHFTQVLAAAMVPGQTVFRRLTAVDIPAAGHPAPPLPHPIRPPIG